MNRATIIRGLTIYPSAVLLALGSSTELRAQVTRAELVESGIDAYLNLETDRAREYFVAAVNPVSQPPDSVWDVAVQSLTQMHLEAGNAELAEVWMRWAVRLVPEMQVDTIEFLPEVAAAHQAALRYVGTGTPGDRFTRTTWDWPALGSRETFGRVALEPTTLPVPVRVTVVGRGTFQSGQNLTLPAGSYAIQAAADGYLAIEITREVLPGVTARLSFDLEPVVVEEALAPDEMPEEVESTALARLARFTATRFRTSPTCGTGFLASAAGLVLTSYTAIRGAESVQVELPDGSRLSDGVTVAAWSVEDNVAVLKLPAGDVDSLVMRTDVSDGQWVWAFGHPGCSTATMSQSRVEGRTEGPTGALRLADSVPEGVQGGPLIDQNGAVLGLMSGPSAAVPADRVFRTLADARENVRRERLLSLRQVAEQERHLFGSILIQSSFESAFADVEPLESWQWMDLAISGPVPLTFTAPMGRYSLAIRSAGQQTHRTEFRINPGVFQEITEPQIVAEGGGGGGGFPLPIALAGGGAAAVVAAVLLLGGGDKQIQEPSTGWIAIPLPQHP